VLKLLAVLAVVGSTTSSLLAVAMTRAKTPGQRRLVVSMHISSGVLLCVVSALLAFWAFTEPDH
jgi:Na+-transporting NADH:ubiquinone oxidoreductase subunit NqrD